MLVVGEPFEALFIFLFLTSCGIYNILSIRVLAFRVPRYNCQLGGQPNPLSIYLHLGPIHFLKNQMQLLESFKFFFNRWNFLNGLGSTKDSPVLTIFKYFFSSGNVYRTSSQTSMVPCKRLGHGRYSYLHSEIKSATVANLET